MEENRSDVSSGLLITPDAVTARTFATARRGYQPDEVRHFLARVADELAAMAGRETELRRALQEALTKAARPELDEEALTAGLGEHAARLIASAREAAAAIVGDAERQAATLVHDAEVRAGRLREESEGLMARRVEEAEAAGASIRQAAEVEVRATRDRARAEAEASVAAAQAQGKEMVGEARAVRERMLGDLSRRRRTAQVQIDQLRAGRQRLLEAYDVVRRTLEEVTRELDAAEAEARVAAEEAGRRTMESDIVMHPDPLATTSAPPAPAAVRTAPSPVPRGPDEPSTGDVAGPPPPSRPRAPSMPAPPPAGPAPAPPAPAPALAVAGPASRPGHERAPRRGIATLDPPRPPALRPQSVAEAAPPRTRPLAVVEPVPEPESLPAPTIEAAIRQPPVAEPPRRAVDALFARLREEVPAPRHDPEPEPEAERQAGAQAAPAPQPDAPPAVPVDVADENALARRDELLDPVESDLTRSLKRVLQDEQNEVLDRLRRTRSTSPDAVLPDRAAQVDRYRAGALPLLERAGTSASPPAGRGAAAAAGQVADVLARELVEPLRARLEQALGQGSGDEGGLFEAVSSIYRQWKVQQIEPLARHGALTSFARGAFAAVPDGTMLRWLVDDEGGRCPDCDDNALAGPVPKGEPFPTGQLHPPAHPGCRCLLVAAVP